MERHVTRMARLVGILCILILLVPVSLAGARPPAQTGATGSRPVGAYDFDTSPLKNADLDAAATLAATKAGNPKLDGALQQLAAAAADSASAVADAAAASGAQLSGDRVQVHIRIDSANLTAARTAVADLGGEITGTSLDQTLIQGFVPAAALDALASARAVNFVKLPEYVALDDEVAPDAGTYNTAGVNAMNANAWHTAGYRGAGVKVAIIDGGFIGYTNAIATGDLPAGVTALSFADGVGPATDTEHGTACAEIVYDIAPQATLYIIKVNTTIDLQEAVTYAIAQGVRVISTSINWFNADAGDGAGFINGEVNRAYNAGIIWLTSAGNYREAHYASHFVSADGDNLHDFAAGVEVNCFAGTAGGNCYNIPSGYGIRVFLRWADWTAPVDQDYDLFIYRWNGSSWVQYASSTGLQSGGAGQLPTEYVGFTTSGSSTQYAIGIQRYSATQTAVNLDVFAPNWPLRYRLGSRSIGNVAPSTNVVAVAALDVTSPFPLESYSSAGPRNGPGGAATGGVTKPEISGFANVDTYSYGTTAGSKFNGTSSATPHVAGAAALVRGAYPTGNVTDIASYLYGRAIDMGAGGKDNDYGWGRVWLGAAPSLSARVRFDLNADRRSDIVWRHATLGYNAVWLMNGASVTSNIGLTRVSDLNWQNVGTGDLNGDGRSDILWRHATAGYVSAWFMNGGTILSSVSLSRVSDLNWRIVGTGDFNGDGRSDILWHHNTLGYVSIWFMNGASILSSVGLPRNTDLGWKIVGTGDFNGDSKADVLWRHATLGYNALWLMNGANIVTAVGLPRVSDANWKIAGVGDYNADTRSDIVWRHATLGYDSLWFMTGSTVLSSASLSRVSDLNWQLIHTGDFNADNRADILWRHATLGYNAVWLMNGSTILSNSSISRVTDNNWRMIGNASAGVGASAGPYAVADTPAAEEASDALSLSEGTSELMALDQISPAMELTSATALPDDPGGELSPAPAAETQVFLPMLMR